MDEARNGGKVSGTLGLAEVHVDEHLLISRLQGVLGALQFKYMLGNFQWVILRLVTYSTALLNLK